MSASPSKELKTYDGNDLGKTLTSKEFLTFMIGEQRFGIPILQVQDVLGEQRVTRIPLAPPEVSGSLNLRGRIVTAINVRRRLSMPENAHTDLKEMSVVVEHEGELYSLIIDRVSDVMNLDDNAFEKSPTTLDATWKEISSGIYRLKGELLIIIDVPKFLGAVSS
jgi:purine-binding chemotaxis protein CheW